MNVSQTYTKQHYKMDLTWDNVIHKISLEYEDPRNFKKLINDGTHAPTIVLHSKTVDNIFSVVYEGKTAYDMHMYVSFGKKSPTFGRHRDIMDVLIVQAIGIIQYSFDDGSIITMNPGDSLFIPKGVFHTPNVMGPRVTLSYGV